jgi:tetratricopeptide (TPR) repeat protein
MMSLLLGVALAAAARWHDGAPGRSDTARPLRAGVERPHAGVSADFAEPDGVEARMVCLADSPFAKESNASDRPEDWVRIGWQWVRKARVSGDTGFYLNVSACAAEALRNRPDDPAALELGALVAMNEHRFAEAKAQCDAILARNAASPLALAILSDALLELGSFEEAAEAAQRSADLKPDSASYARAAWFRWLSGDTGNAKRFIRAALEGRDRRDPEPTAWTFVEAAKMFWHEGDYAGADAVLTEALQWVADYAPALVAKGRVALSLKQPERAIPLLESAYRRQPLPETAWLLADAREMLGDLEGAEIERVRVERTGRRGDKLTLALFYATKNRSIDEALRLMADERRERGGVLVDDAWAWTLFRAGRLEEARVASEQAMRLGTPDARILYHAGAIRIAAGLPGGRPLIEKALALNPEFDRTGAAEAREMLARMQAGEAGVARSDS